MTPEGTDLKRVVPRKLFKHFDDIVEDFSVREIEARLRGLGGSHDGATNDVESLAALTLAAPSQALGAPSDSAGKATAESCPCEMINCAGGMQPGMGGGPMSGICGRMVQMADVTVEYTPNGAAVHLNAKDSSQLEAVRQMAQRMGRCMCGPTMAPPARPPYRPDQR